MHCSFLVHNRLKQGKIDLAKLWQIFTPGQIPKSIDRAVLAACAVYGLLLVAFWLVARHYALEVRIQGHMASSFTSFALLLAPYWFFGFGAAGEGNHPAQRCSYVV